MRNLLVHVDHRRHLFFREEKDLQHEMFPFIGTAGQSRLPHEDEAGQKDSLHGNNGSEKRKGHGIKMRNARQMQGVYENPENEEQDMSGYISEIADDGSRYISQSFRRRSSRQKLMLMFRDCVYVLLHLIRSLHCVASYELSLSMIG